MGRFQQVIVAVMITLGVVVFLTTFARATLVPSQDATATPAAVIAAAPGEYPARLRIPVLGINAAVQQTGINAHGAMGVPTNFTDVAWYDLGPLPGKRGSAVIDGHVDNGLALAGVFKQLANIKKGDDIFVDTKDGHTLHFVVTDIEIYPYQSVPTDIIFNRADTARLNLITCDGTWVKSGKTYNERLVVFAELQ